jgi:hypothetical protein
MLTDINVECRRFTRPLVRLLCSVAVVSFIGGASDPRPLSMCELSSDFSAYRDKHVAVRGVYYNGLRQACEQKCADGPWPSFMNLAGEGANWEAIEGVQRTAEIEAKKGKKLEIWVTAVGQLKTQAKHSPVGPCDKSEADISDTGPWERFQPNWWSKTSVILRSKKIQSRRMITATCTTGLSKLGSSEPARVDELSVGVTAT